MALKKIQKPKKMHFEDRKILVLRDEGKKGNFTVLGEGILLETHSFVFPNAEK